MPSTKRCSVPLCADPPRSNGLCTRHYWRQRRGRPLEDVPGVGEERVTVRCSAELVALTERAAHAEGVTLATWWRRAAEAAVLRQEAERRQLRR